MCNRFLTAKQDQLDVGEITVHTWNKHKITCDKIVKQFGKNRLVIDLASEDFEALRKAISKNCNLVTIGSDITRVRVVFKYAYDSGLIDRPLRYGPQFKRPSKKAMRIERSKQLPRLFEAVDIYRILQEATPSLHAMILLAINCGFGNADCATLTIHSIDLQAGWINFPRPKTGINRRCPIWKETAQSLTAILAKRKTPKDELHKEYVFITKAGGSFSKDTPDNPISKEFTKLLTALGLRQKFRGFYSLRHTFRTIADESHDQPACDALMGHARDDMASIYRERIGDSRLLAVSNYVRAWLFST